MTEPIYVTRDGPIATVVLNRPEKLNAMSVAYHCFDTEDFQIGYRAFLAKTTPRFVGR